MIYKFDDLNHQEALINELRETFGCSEQDAIYKYNLIKEYFDSHTDEFIRLVKQQSTLNSIKRVNNKLNKSLQLSFVMLLIEKLEGAMNGTYTGYLEEKAKLVLD